MSRRPLTLFASAWLVVGCLQSSPPADEPMAEGAIVISMQDMAFVPDTIELTSGFPLTVTLTNDGGIVHDLVFEGGWSSGEVRPGRSVEVDLPEFASATTGWCTVPGHRGAGMEVTVVISP